jgi:D-glycero-D-manno-heptose 1,7-bisphosphate phosphatase
MKRAIFLDRDGVLNTAFVVGSVPKPAKTLDELQILPRVSEALEMLRGANFELVVVTNQPDVARGEISSDSVSLIHSKLQDVLQLKHFYTCFHDDSDNCSCRKPKPGLIVQAAQELALDLNGSYMVGDRWRDIDAGQSAGCRCFFIDHFYAEKQPKMPYTKVSSLFEAVQKILGEVHGTIGK